MDPTRVTTKDYDGPHHGLGKNKYVSHKELKVNVRIRMVEDRKKIWLDNSHKVYFGRNIFWLHLILEKPTFF